MKMQQSFYQIGKRAGNGIYVSGKAYAYGAVGH